MQERLIRVDRLDTFVGGEWLTRAALLARLGRWAAVVRRWLLSDILSIFLATRLAFLLLTYFGRPCCAIRRWWATRGRASPATCSIAWFYRDSQWFLTIVHDGYHYFGPGHRSALAFFPVFRCGEVRAHPHRDRAGDLGDLVANVAFLGALIYMQRLCRHEYGESTARRAVFYMAIFPTSFFTFAPYSEALFLMLSLGSLYYTRKQQWWLAGLFGGLAAATRILGFVLVLAFAWEYLRTHRFDPRRFRVDVLAGALIPAGLGLYMLYLYGLTGDPLAFVRARAAGTVRPRPVGGAQDQPAGRAAGGDPRPISRRMPSSRMGSCSAAC